MQLLSRGLSLEEECASDRLTYQYKNIIFAPMQANFKEHAPHLEGCTVHIATTANTIATFGSDDVAFALDLNTQESQSHTIDNKDREEITALAMDPRNLNSFIIGTAAGCVKRLWPLHNYDLGKAVMVYKCDRPIRSLAFHPKGKLLGIATDDEQAIVLSIVNHQIFSLWKAHQGGVSSIFFGGSYVYSLGLQGYIHIYELKQPNNTLKEEQSDSEDPVAEITPIYEFPFIDRYKIATEAITRKHPYFNAVYAELKGETVERVVLASGQTSLQMVELDGASTAYRIERAIRENDQILIVQILGEEERQQPQCIVTSSAASLSIWNYARKERIFSLLTTEVLKGVITAMPRVNTPEGSSFAFLTNHKESSGKLHIFTNLSLLSAKPMEGNQDQPALQGKKKQFVSRWEEPCVNKLIPDYTQYLLSKAYDEYQGACFLYYNSIGCVVRRSEGTTSTIELQLHEKNKPKRLFIDARNRPFQYFAIRQDLLAYATSTLLVFQSQRQLREGHEGWQFRWDNIQAVGIGNCWVGVCANDAVKILDYSGNQLHTICFDRRFVTAEFYEDMLAVVYHSCPPMFGCQVLKVRIYRITPEAIKLERDTFLPIKSNQLCLLKWLGFSEQGMLYCQDTLEVLRAYIFQRDEWVPVYSLEGTTEKLFIQHISRSEIYGFKLDQKNGKHEPRVLPPSSVPRRIPMDLPFLPLGFLTKEEDAHLRQLRLGNIILQHENFRHRRWFKYKYSRKKNHPWYSLSSSIYSAEQLKTQATKMDRQLLKYLQKFLNRSQDKHSKEFQKAAQALQLIINREAHFDETKESARILLETGKMQRSQILDGCVIGTPVENKTCANKLGQVNILQKMLRVMNRC